jgi:GTP-binding protein
LSLLKGGILWLIRLLGVNAVGATVAIVSDGRMSASPHLFNRLVGKRFALVDDTPGVTRDRSPGEARLGDLRFTIMSIPLV